MTFSSISILLMAIGIASDNLLFAGINGKGFQITRNINCILTLFLLFILQTQMMMCGSKMALAASGSKTSDKGMALFVLFLTGIIMLYHSLDKKCHDECFRLRKWQLLHYAFSTSFLVLASSFAIRLHTSNDFKFSLYMMPLLLVFIATGLLLGMLDKTTALRWLHITGTICFAFGLILLLL